MLKKEVLSIVVSIIVLGLLIYLAVSLYSLLKSQTAKEQAKANLDEIINKIATLQEDGNSAEHLYTGQKGWALIYYNQDSGKSVPKSCAKWKNCLCICSTAKESDFSGRADLQICESKGVCQDSKIVLDILELNSKNEKVNYIILGENFMIIDMLKKGQIVEITRRKGESLAGTDKALFDNLLTSKSGFLGEEKTIQEQILSYVNSGDWGSAIDFSVVFKGDGAMKDTLSENIKKYFENYSWPIYVIIKEAGKDEQQPSILAVSAGKEREIVDGTILPSWPDYIISNPGKKDIAVVIQWRR